MEINLFNTNNKCARIEKYSMQFYLEVLAIESLIQLTQLCTISRSISLKNLNIFILILN